MKKIIFVFLIISFVTSVAGAEDLYTWTDKNGVENITTTPPPEKVKVKHQTKYKRPSAQESEAFQRKASAAVNNSYRGWQNSQKQTAGTPSSSSPSQSQKKGKELWAEYDEASKEYHKAQYEGDKTPAHKDPKRKALFDTMEKAIDYQLSQ